MDESLSNRGQLYLRAAARPDLDLYFDAIQNLYHPVNNVSGSFPLNMAENRLTWGVLKEKLERVAREKEIPCWVAGYTSPHGHEAVREVIAKFLSSFLIQAEVSPQNIAFSAGSTAVIELTSFLLAEKGDTAVFPAPAYPVYSQDISVFSGMTRHDLITHNDLEELRDGPTLNIRMLDKTLIDLKSRGKNFRMLVITNPDNPTGIIYNMDLLVDIAGWCISKRIHLVVNEIYGLSIRSDVSSGGDEATFSSFGKYISESRSPYLHLWYALSKDFGISGFRMGILYSENNALLKAYGNVNLGNMVSNHTQWLMHEVFSDRGFIEKFIDENQKNLTRAYSIVTTRLESLDIPFVKSRGSLFVWADFSKFLLDPSEEAEHLFWLKLYEESRVLLTPGRGFGHSKTGLFRIVISFLPIPHLKVAMQKIEDFLKSEFSEF